MTREPDRFDAQAGDLLRLLAGDPNYEPELAPRKVAYGGDALRAAESSALERAAQAVDLCCNRCGERIRALIPPAAAPAADYDPITAPIPEGDMNGPHGPIRTVPMMPVDEAADARMDALSAAQPREKSRPLDELAAVLRGKDEMGEKLAKALGVTAAPLGRLVDEAVARIAELETKLNTPELHDFAKGVLLEAAHQRARWGTDHDGGKEPSDWFWLVGYLAGKALHAHAEGRHEKALHHTITAASALANWHSAILGKTNMRPGIEPPAQPAAPPEGPK